MLTDKGKEGSHLFIYSISRRRESGLTWLAQEKVIWVQPRNRGMEVKRYKSEKR